VVGAGGVGCGEGWDAASVGGVDAGVGCEVVGAGVTVVICAELVGGDGAGVAGGVVAGFAAG